MCIGSQVVIDEVGKPIYDANNVHNDECLDCDCMDDWVIDVKFIDNGCSNIGDDCGFRLYCCTMNSVGHMIVMIDESHSYGKNDVLVANKYEIIIAIDR